jgi:precorrin isomerase
MTIDDSKVTIDDSKDQQLSRAATIVRQQITRIAELEAEVDRLMAVIANIPDALTRLQRLYTDPKYSPSLVATRGLRPSLRV